MRPMLVACGSLVLALLACGGCVTSPQAIPPIPEPAAGQTPVPEPALPVIPTGFAPAKISILPLSEITFPAGREARLHAYVSLLDAFGCSIKAPCTLRFELYEYVLRSAQPKGQRVAIWPDIDLTHPAENHKSWRDFLRAYEFFFPVRVDRDKTYVLEATYLGPDGRRLTGQGPIRAGQ